MSKKKPRHFNYFCISEILIVTIQIQLLNYHVEFLKHTLKMKWLFSTENPVLNVTCLYL